MRPTRKGISTAVMSIVVVVLLIVVGVGAFYTGQTMGGTTTVTTSGGTGSTVTVTSTVNSSLVAQAQAQGGTLTVYGLIDQNAWQSAVTPAFKAVYPWATLNFLSLSSGDLANKVIAEQKAGVVQGDVFQSPIANAMTFKSLGYLQPYCNPMIALEGYSSDFVDPTCYFEGGQINTPVLQYNTNLVKDTSTLPKSWSDIANPIWKGKIAIDRPQRLSTGAFVLYYIGENMTASQWQTWLQNFAANQPLVTPDSGGVYTDVSGGQAAIGVGAIEDVVTGANSGAPVSYEWLTPIPYGQFPYMIAKGTSHLAMSELFLQWLVSYGGQVAIGHAGRDPILPGALAATIKFPIPPPAGATYFPEGSTPPPQGNPAFLTNSTFYKNVYTQVFGP